MTVAATEAFLGIMYALCCWLFHMATECSWGCVFFDGKCVNTLWEAAALSLSAAVKLCSVFYMTAVNWRMKTPAHTERSGLCLWDVGMRCRSKIQNVLGLKRGTTRFMLVGAPSFVWCFWLIVEKASLSWRVSLPDVRLFLTQSPLEEEVVLFIGSLALHWQVVFLGCFEYRSPLWLWRVKVFCIWCKAKNTTKPQRWTLDITFSLGFVC